MVIEWNSPHRRRVPETRSCLSTPGTSFYVGPDVGDPRVLRPVEAS